MLKKIIIGILCFVILAVTGAGIYLYTLDWNKHKAVVAQRFSQITGLKALIDGNLKVELFPSPKFTANKVKFFKNNGGRDPLVVVNDITSSVELMPLFDNKFILKSMTLTGATVSINVSENGDLNWAGVGNNGNNKSGNVEVSFNDIRLTNSMVSYVNKQTGDKFELPNISASVSAPSLKGPYKTDGRFIHNNSEIKFNGTIVNDKALSLKMSSDNASTGTKFSIDGTLGKNAKGTITFDTKSLSDIAAVIFGENTLSDTYDTPLYLSFEYDYNSGQAKLNNFAAKYGQNTAGSGSLFYKEGATGRKEISASFDMAKFDLGVLEDICADFVSHIKSGKSFAETEAAKFDASLNLKAGSAWYKQAEAQNFSLGMALKEGSIDVTRFGILMPGDTAIKAVGKINLDKGIDFVFNQSIDSKDLRTFASVFNIDLTKLTAPENKKSVFKRAQAEIKLNGNLDSIKVSIPKAIIDSTAFRGDLGFVNKDGKTFVLADIESSKIIFDKYLRPLPQNLEQGSLKDKFVYQLNLLPWNRDLDIEANISIASAVYNQIPFEKISLDFRSYQEALQIKKLSIENAAGALVNISFDADKAFSDPYFNELSYDVRTSNFPLFASSLGIKTGKQPLFKRKIFATQGALSGSMSEFSLSSVQKFGDTEFSYTGVVSSKEGETSVNGDLELKSNNFTNFVKALNLDYTPDIPVTTFTLAGKIKGNVKTFAVENANAYLGANHINGSFIFDNSAEKPKLQAELDFDKFDADRLFNLNKKKKAAAAGSASPFITKPDISSDKIDYAALGKIDFDIKTTAKLLTYSGKNYADARLDAMLNKNILTVKKFEAKRDDSSINLDFILESNNLPKISGNFNIKQLELPALGGSVYQLSESPLSAEGSFNSSAASEKEFLENLNSKGKFQLSGAAMKGWDFDLIKFELEQRKKIAGFEDFVYNSLKNGKSSFSAVRGNYSISKGLVVSDRVVWESPVVTMNMKFDLNLSDWLFNADFNTVYLNASFADVLKFSYSGSLANPVLKVDLSESIARISETEDKINNAREYAKQEQKQRISGKAGDLESEIKETLREITRMTLEIVRFKPASSNTSVIKIYNDNSQAVKNAEKNINALLEKLGKVSTEEELSDLEAAFGVEKSKLKFIPKALEENYIVDGKYIFDNTFNKIAWLYNLASNNSAYYNGLTEIYMTQVKILDNTETPVAKNTQQKLKKDMEKAALDMDKIDKLHARIRDNYLDIIDTNKVSEMRENNEIAAQALETILSYTKQLNKDIINSLDNFREALDIKARDYDQYLIYPPENSADIDVTKPVVKAEGKPAAEQKTETDTLSEVQENNTVKEQTDAEEPKVETKENETLSDTAEEALQSATDVVEDKKKSESVSLSFSELHNGLAGLFNRLMPKVEAKMQSKPTEVKVAEAKAPSKPAEVKVAEVKAQSKPAEVKAAEVKAPSKPAEIKVAEVKAQSKPTEVKVAEVKTLSKPAEVKAAEAKVPSKPAEVKVAEVKAPNKSAEVKVAKIKAPSKPAEVKVAEVKAPSKPAEVKVAAVKAPSKPAEVKAAEVKAQSKPTEVKVAATKAPTKPAEAKVAEARAAEVPVIKKAAVISEEDILTRTKLAIADIMNKIRQTEKGFKDMLSARNNAAVKTGNTTENKEALTDISVAESSLPIKQEAPAGDKKSSLKINPVIALDIGKGSQTADVYDIKEKTSHKKSGFGVKKTAAAAESGPIPSVTAFFDNEDVKAPDAAERSAYKQALVNLLKEEDNTANFSVLTDTRTDDAFTSVSVANNGADKSKRNKYVFAANLTPKQAFSGNLGKQMLADKPQPTSSTAENKYVFAANHKKVLSFGGDVGKSMLSLVK